MLVSIDAVVSVHALTCLVEDTTVLHSLSSGFIRNLKLFDAMCKLAEGTIIARLELNPILAQFSFVFVLGEIKAGRVARACYL